VVVVVVVAVVVVVPAGGLDGGRGDRAGEQVQH